MGFQAFQEEKMRPTPSLRTACLTAAAVIALMALAASPASAMQSKDDRVTGSLTAAGCLLTDSVSWSHLPPIYEIDTELNQNGAPFINGASIISYPTLDQPALTSPQVIETFFFDPDVFTFDYSVTFTMRDRQRRVLATETSQALALNCFP